MPASKPAPLLLGGRRMTDNLVKRLRDLNTHMDTFILDEAADRIEHLEAALREYRHDLCEYPSGDLCGKLNEEVCQGCTASAALAGERKE